LLLYLPRYWRLGAFVLPIRLNALLRVRAIRNLCTRVGSNLFIGSEHMTNTQEKHVTRTALSKGYTLEKVGKGPHHGRFSLLHKAEGARMHSGVPGAEFSFSLQEAEDWLAKAEK
jgi:hypothetical protein